MDHGLFEYSTKLLAARSPAFLDMDVMRDEELQLVCETLLAASYTESVVLQASGACSLTEFVLPKSSPRIESQLQAWERESTHEARDDTADLMRLLLLHQTLPVSRVAAILGQEVYDILLQHQVWLRVVGQVVWEMKNFAVILDD